MSRAVELEVALRVQPGRVLAPPFAGAPFTTRPTASMKQRIATGVLHAELVDEAYAESLEMTEIVPEDFQHGRLYGTVSARNPFI